jgi:hypothetical protein
LVFRVTKPDNRVQAYWHEHDGGVQNDCIQNTWYSTGVADPGRYYTCTVLQDDPANGAKNIEASFIVDGLTYNHEWAAADNTIYYVYMDGNTDYDDFTAENGLAVDTNFRNCMGYSDLEAIDMEFRVRITSVCALGQAMTYRRHYGRAVLH